MRAVTVYLLKRNIVEAHGDNEDDDADADVAAATAAAGDDDNEDGFD